MKTLKYLIAISFILVGLSFAASAQISLSSIDGGTVAVDLQKGKVVILAIGATWLPLSKDQAAYTNALAKKYAGKDVMIYFVATDSTSQRSKNFASDDDVKKFRMGLKLTVPVLRDPDGTAVMKNLEIDQVPTFIILDKTGNQAGESFSGIDPKFDITVPISRAVDRLL